MSTNNYVNRVFSWDFDSLKRFNENYVLAIVNKITGWTSSQKKQARANIGFGDGVIDSEPTPNSQRAVNSGSVHSFVANKVSEAIADIHPIVIEGDVTNAADEEDLTSQSVGGTDVIRFKDKVYSPLTHSGLGRKYLRKNIVNGANILTSAMVSEANTIYHIQYDYDLNGQTITLPTGSTLSFEGGSLSNGTITGNGTLVTGDYAFNSVNFAGTFINESFDINDKFTGTIDFYGILRAFSGAKINLYQDITITTHDDGYIGTTNLNGHGCTIKVVEFYFSTTANVYLEDCVFDCSLSGLQRTEHGFLNIGGNASNIITIKGCKFIHVQDGINHTYFRNVKDILIEDSSFVGDFTEEGTPGGRVLFGYSYVDTFEVKGCTISNCSGIGITALSQPNRGPVVTNCVIENTGLAGIMLAGGMYVDSVISNCIVKNTNLTGVSDTGAQYAAINYHGYRNLMILNNQIDAPNSAGLDLEGADNGTFDRGDGAIVQGNNIKAKVLDFLGSKNTIVQNNSIYLTGNINIVGKVSFLQNKIRGVSLTAGTASLFKPTSATANPSPLDLEIYNNEIVMGAESTSKNWLYATSSTCAKSGSKIKIKGCTITHESGTTPDITGASGVISGLIELLDGMQHIIMDIDLSTAQQKMILSRSNYGRVLSVSAYSKGEVTLGSATSVHLGLWRHGVGTEATNFGDLALSGNYNTTAKDISLNNKTPNNEANWPGTSDLYATFAGSTNTGTIYLDFMCTNGKYKLYY